MAAETTSTLSNEMMTFLVRTFLERSKQRNIHGEGAKERKHPKNSGETMTWNRYDPLGSATTALTEATNPTESSITSNTVSATLNEYGDFVKVSSKLRNTSIDRESKEKTELVSQQASETLDTLVRDELFSGATTQLANGKSNITDIGSSDTMDVDEIRKAVRELKKKNSMEFDDGYFMGKVGPDTSYDIMGDSVWVDAHTYKDGQELYKGELGKLHRVRFLEASSNQKSESSSVTVYSNFIHGKEAFGTVDLSGNNKRLIIKNPDKGDTSNPLNMFITIGWKATFASKTLNSDWIRNVKTAATA